MTRETKEVYCATENKLSASTDYLLSPNLLNSREFSLIAEGILSLFIWHLFPIAPPMIILINEHRVPPQGKFASHTLKRKSGNYFTMLLKNRIHRIIAAEFQETILVDQSYC